jgi:hypothetical protein
MKHFLIEIISSKGVLWSTLCSAVQYVSDFFVFAVHRSKTSAGKPLFELRKLFFVIMWNAADTR